MTTAFPSVIKLNVGGEHFTTQLETLTKEADSRLSAMFTGKEPITQDQDGRYLIDENPSGFSALLDYLQSGETPNRGMVLETRKLAEKLGIKSFIETTSDCKVVIADKYRRKIKTWYPNYDDIFKKVIEDIEIKLSKANTDTFEFQLQPREEQQIIPGEKKFLIRPVPEDPNCFLLFVILQADLRSKGFFWRQSKWIESSDGQKWRGSLTFSVENLLAWH